MSASLALLIPPYVREGALVVARRAMKGSVLPRAVPLTEGTDHHHYAPGSGGVHRSDRAPRVPCLGIGALAFCPTSLWPAPLPKKPHWSLPTSGAGGYCQRYGGRGPRTALVVPAVDGPR